MLRPSGIIWRNREEATEQSEVTAKHGDTKKRSHTEGGSTGVAKRRALPDRIGNTSAIPARSVRVSDPIQQRQVGLLRGPTRCASKRTHPERCKSSPGIRSPA